MLSRMCGRYTNTAGVDELNERFKVPIPSSAGTRRYNIAPTEEVLAIVAPKGVPQARLLRWGLVPPWASGRKGAQRRIKARIETLRSSPPYRTLTPRGSSRG